MPFTYQYFVLPKQCWNFSIIISWYFTNFPHCIAHFFPHCPPCFPVTLGISTKIWLSYYKLSDIPNIIKCIITSIILVGQKIFNPVKWNAIYQDSPEVEVLFDFCLLCWDWLYMGVNIKYGNALYRREVCINWLKKVIKDLYLL